MANVDEDAGDDTPVGLKDTPVDTGNALDDAGTAGTAPAKPKLDASVKPAPTSDAQVAQADARSQAMSDAATKSGDGGGLPDAGALPPGVRPLPKCMHKDSQLMMIGDSYINWPSHTFPEDIAMKSGQTWRLDAVGGYSMASGGLGLIPPEFDDDIKVDSNAHTVLMDGGGNDVLLADPTLDAFGSCQMTGSSKLANCQSIVQMAVDAADGLLQRMASAGIRDVIYFFYPHVPANTIISGPNPNEILDYALPLVKSFCESREAKSGGKLRCTFVDLVPVFAGHDNWFNTDIHPNPTGSAAMAKTIWGVMKDKCIGQKTGAGCCEE